MRFTPANWSTAERRYHTLTITMCANGQNVVEIQTTDGQKWHKPWRRQLTQGTHIPALYSRRDCGEEGGLPVHFGNISVQVHTERPSGARSGVFPVMAASGAGGFAGVGGAE